MGDTPHAPHRFRRRLRAAFVLVAALSSATLAVMTYGATSSYRWRNFQEMADSEVRLALALAPSELDRTGFERLLTAYEKRSGTDVVAIGPDGAFYASSRTIEPGELPEEVLVDDGGDLVTTETERTAGSVLAVAGDGPDGARYVFFFSLEQLESSLAELRIVLAWAWVGVVVVAAAVGELVARRTLRPVREASEASTALAAGLLDTRLPSVGDDEFAAWASSFNDMADALAAKIDELRLAAERERQFTADVAHDLRTPLTGMAVRASLLLDEAEEAPPAMRHGIRALAQDIDRLKELVLDLLELARLDASDQREPTEPLSVSTSIEVSVRTLELPDGVEVILDIPPRLSVRSARGAFRRIIANLVANAAVHGRGPVTVSARRNGDSVCIDVADHGPGIDEADRERIFHRFAKTDESRAAGGSGLGLAIAREHARAQGGDIRAGSSSTGGARFTVTLPAADRSGADASADDPGPDTAVDAPPPTRPATERPTRSDHASWDPRPRTSSESAP